MDDQGNAVSLGETFRVVDMAHQQLHVMEVTADDPTLTVALNEREILMLCAALPTLEVFYPCLHELSVAFQDRVIELARAQRPDFKLFRYGG